MKKIVYIFLIFINSLFAVESNVLELQKIYDGPFNINSICIATCRELKSDYQGIIMDFNPFNGVTKCRIIKKGEYEDDGSNFVADTLNQTCINQTSQKVNENTLVSYGKRFDNNVTLTYKKQDTLSKLFVGTLTLDDDIINIPATINSNSLVLRNNKDMFENISFSSLNSANLGFFVNLIYGFQKIYAYLQYFMFIFIGAFFLIIYIWEIAVNKIGKTGEKEKMNKFVIPLVMILLCFVPIPKQGGITTTPIQSIIQYYMQHSNQLADRVSIIGSEAYIKKLYGLLGTNKAYEEKELAERVLNLNKAINFMKSTYLMCRNAFPNHKEIFSYKSFQISDEEQIKKIEATRNKNYQAYSFEGCKNIERTLFALEREKIEKEAMLQGIKHSLSTTVQNQLSNLKKEIEYSNNSYGWIYTLLLPTNSIVIDNLGWISNNVVQNKIKERNIELSEKYNLTFNNEYITDVEDGSYMGSLAYFVLPGASGIYNAIMDSGKSLEKTGKAMGMKLGKQFGSFAKVFERIEFFGLTQAVFGGVKAISAVSLIRVIYSTILEYLPLIVGLIAGFIAFGIYMIQLFKYFYISPFIVLYSVTKQRQTKIIDFLVDGISLFLKPLLITISILLSLVIYYLFSEVFMGLTTLNFEFIARTDNDYFNFMNGLTIATFTTMLFILVSIATAYLMYQIIINGSKMFLTLAGLQDKDSLSSSLSQRMDKYSMQV